MPLWLHYATNNYSLILSGLKVLTFDLLGITICESCHWTSGCHSESGARRPQGRLRTHESSMEYLALCVDLDGSLDGSVSVELSNCLNGQHWPDADLE